jgi:F-type H+-transporting ATPase subunit gamma
MPAVLPRCTGVEKNIDSLSKELNRSSYRLRQNFIDEELFDVIVGFNSLSSAK